MRTSSTLVSTYRGEYPVRRAHRWADRPQGGEPSGACVRLCVCVHESTAPSVLGTTTYSATGPRDGTLSITGLAHEQLPAATTSRCECRA